MKRFNVRYAETFLWDMIDITFFYVIDGDDMDVRRILWSGADDIDKL